MSERPKNIPAATADGLGTEILDWLAHFAERVRERDLIGARAMFCPQVTSFGTWTDRMDGLDALVDHQWRNVWPRTCGFEFDLTNARGSTTKHDLAWAAVTWSSRALSTDGSPGFLRKGRATFTFRRENGRFLAVHSHFSLDPTGRL